MSERKTTSASESVVEDTHGKSWMEFEARQLKSYAEPVPIDSLSIGEVYFNVLFVDDDILIPTMQPVVFIGKNLASGDTDSLYFQDAESYREGIRFGPSATESGATFFTGSTQAVFTYERALDLLMACSLRRRERGLA
jgi:hypothetical protein